MPATPTPLSADRLESLLDQRQEMTARPRARPGEVLAAWMGNAGVGVGAGIGFGVVLRVFGAPSPVLGSIAPAAGLLTFAAMMVWRGAIDEGRDAANSRAIRREIENMRAEVAAIRSAAQAQTATMRAQLDAAFDEIETLEHSLDQVARERDLALIDLGRERAAAAKKSNWTPAEAAEPQDVADAGEMVRHFFSTGSHLSRRQADDLKHWPATRHAAAQGVLVRAGVLTVNKTQPVMVAQTLDEATQKLGAWYARVAAQQPPVIAPAATYVESDLT